jgi:hypothetical protein
MFGLLFVITVSVHDSNESMLFVPLRLRLLIRLSNAQCHSLPASSIPYPLPHTPHLRPLPRAESLRRRSSPIDTVRANLPDAVIHTQSVINEGAGKSWTHWRCVRSAEDMGHQVMYVG